MKIVPTLGDLKKSLGDEGLPPPGADLGFDTETEGAPGFLPDSLLVSRRLCQRALEGAYDGFPDDTPIEALPFEG